MIGKSAILWVCLATTASGILYHTSYRVQEQAERLASINHRIVAEQEAIQVLKAEWAYLNDPTRIEQLVREHSILQPTRVDQMVTLEALPDRLPEGELAAAAPVPGRKPDHGETGRDAPTPRKPEGPVLLAKFGAGR